MTVGTDINNNIHSSKIELILFKGYKANEICLSQNVEYLQNIIRNLQSTVLNNDAKEIDCNEEIDVTHVDCANNNELKQNSELYSADYYHNNTYCPTIQQSTIAPSSFASSTVDQSCANEAQERMAAIEKEIAFGRKMFHSILSQQQNQHALDNEDVKKMNNNVIPTSVLHTSDHQPYDSSVSNLQKFASESFASLSLAKFDESKRERKRNERSMRGSFGNFDEIQSHMSLPCTSNDSPGTSCNIKFEFSSSASDNSMSNNPSKNKLGRTYNPGRPLSMQNRNKILELYQKGLKISHIAKIIGVTHSCVSKIMSRYRKTGSMSPRCGESSCTNNWSRNRLHPASPFRSLSNSSSPLPSSHFSRSPMSSSTPSSTYSSRSPINFFEDSLNGTRFSQKINELNLNSTSYVGKEMVTNISSEPHISFTNLTSNPVDLSNWHYSFSPS